jgi:hypothetical protein
MSITSHVPQRCILWRNCGATHLVPDHVHDDSVVGIFGGLRLRYVLPILVDVGLSQGVSRTMQGGELDCVETSV